MLTMYFAQKKQTKITQDLITTIEITTYILTPLREKILLKDCQYCLKYQKLFDKNVASS